MLLQVWFITTHGTYILCTVRNQAGHSAIINTLLSVQLNTVLSVLFKRTYMIFFFNTWKFGKHLKLVNLHFIVEVRIWVFSQLLFLWSWSQDFLLDKIILVNTCCAVGSEVTPSTSNVWHNIAAKQGVVPLREPFSVLCAHPLHRVVGRTLWNLWV